MPRHSQDSGLVWYSQRGLQLKQSRWSSISYIPVSYVGQISDPAGWLSQIPESIALSQPLLTGADGF